MGEAGGRCSPFLVDDGLHRGYPVAAPGVAAELECICAPLPHSPQRP